MSDEQRPPLSVDSISRRHLTILFTDLSNSTRLSGSMEVEVYAELTRDIRQAFKDIVRERGGIVNQFQGDGLQALFGYPHSNERDGVRATEAALHMHEMVRALRTRYAPHGAGELSVHSGVHAGLALAQAGDEAAARVELFGPVPGIAKHLSDVAEEDEILVSEETLGPGSELFQTSERRLVLLKGRAEPLAVHRIHARSSLRTRFEAHSRRGLVPLAGRSAQMQRIDGALAEAALGRVRLVALCGAAGVGKTRLAEAVLPLAAARGFAVMSGYCEEELSAQPLQPLLHMLRATFGLTIGTEAATAAQRVESGLAGIDPKLLGHRGELLRALSIAEGGEGREGDAAPARRPAPDRTTRALRDVIAALAQRRALALFVDDWQWVDDATRQVIDAITRLPASPILLLLAVRGPWVAELQPTTADVIALEPLDEVDSDLTIGRLLPGADPYLAADIRRFSGGNPLFIEELCHSVRVGGAHALLGPVQRGSAWLETLIESRVARLEPEHREVLDTAAVIGNVVPGWLLARLCGCGADHPVVRALASLDLIYPGEAGEAGESRESPEGGAVLRFKHGITRHVVYSTIGLQKKRELHRRVAELIAERAEPAAQGEACEALAYHWGGAAMFEQGARFAEAAGDKAMAASSLDRARTQFRAAIDMLERLPSTPQRYQAWRSLVRRLGLVAVYDPSRADLEIFARAVARAGDHGDSAGLAYAEYWRAYVTYALGESRAAVPQAERALQVAARTRDAALLPQLLALHGQALAAAAHYPAALERLDDSARQMRERQGGGRPLVGLAYALACKASVLGDRGEFDAAHACFEEAMAALPAPGHEVEGSVLCWRSGVHLWQGRWDEARADAEAARRVADRVKSLYLTGMSRALAACAGWMTAPAGKALREMADSVVWLDSRGKSLFVSLIHGWLAEALAGTGAATGADVAEARRHAAWTMRRTRKSDWIGAAMAMRAMARLAAARGDALRAQRHMATADEVARVRASAHEAANNELCRGQLAIALGQRAEGAAYLDRAGAAFERLRMPWHLRQVESLLQAPSV